jgi:hypothetical protein
MANWILGYIDSLEGAIGLSLFHKEVLRRNEVFKNKHKNKRAFVIVNGPSLREQDISNLENEVTFVVSGFWRHEIVKKWQPTYYSLLDSNLFKSDKSTLIFYKKLRERIFDSIFFVPLLRGFDTVKKFNLLPEEKVHYVATAGDFDTDNDLTKVVQSFAGVSAFSLSQAIYMGCNPIYLIGFDHDYLANRGIDKHFYEGGTVTDDPGASLLDRIAYDEEMKANLRLWRNYRSLKVIAEKKGIKIFNATKGGYLDVFPRVDYESIDLER